MRNHIRRAKDHQVLGRGSFAYGDLPYACDGNYSQDTTKFKGPTRVVGRLPDLRGAREPSYLLKLLKIASTWRPRDVEEYSRYFGMSTQSWEGSTAMSLFNIFGNSDAMSLAPPTAPPLSAAKLAPLMHFINCHGGSSDPRFFGETRSLKSQPVSMTSDALKNKIKPGTVASIECCYGAELYDSVTLALPMPICQRYLEQGAYGYFGSSTIAYGPPSGNGAADLLCQYFLRRVIAGSSLGRAALEARLEFSGGAAELDPVDLKTLAQFSLLGDPSIHCVAASVPLPTVATPKSAASAKGFAAAIADAAVARTDRRRQLFSRGARIGATQACAIKIAKPKLGGALTAVLEKMAAQLSIHEPKILSYKVESPAAPKSGPLAFARKSGPFARLAEPDTFHVVTGARTVPQITLRQVVAMVAKEVGGKIVSYREMQSR